ncbi:uncharacterized protein N7473_000104 [Penicillium subrubescens]|uniref:Uncharacterized protein n=1 Tax=Penicillium subrubescens TaxID=1316194 RepID=A0A1Q5TT33_9EURO|nr:uncharacterized protein N7473_000104 [Penicillium subrubescens]KAJ5910801.1 hypothetical protein N7473_000104 [Penicillium subrubescens]OKP03394.1 hypothetical protein PENSUB_6897 [Penicillium subrubescens]
MRPTDRDFASTQRVELSTSSDLTGVVLLVPPDPLRSNHRPTTSATILLWSKNHLQRSPALPSNPAKRARLSGPYSEPKQSQKRKRASSIAPPPKTGSHTVRDTPSKSCKTGRSDPVPDHGQKRKAHLKTVSQNLRDGEGVAERRDHPAGEKAVTNLTVYQDGKLCNLKPEAHCTIIHRAARLMRQHWSDDHRDVKPLIPKFKPAEVSSKTVDEGLMRQYTVPVTCQKLRGAVPGESRYFLIKIPDAAPESKPRSRDVQKTQTTAHASPPSFSPKPTKPEKAIKSNGACPKPRRKD